MRALWKQLRAAQRRVVGLGVSSATKWVGECLVGMCRPVPAKGTWGCGG